MPMLTMHWKVREEQEAASLSNAWLEWSQADGSSEAKGHRGVLGSLEGVERGNSRAACILDVQGLSMTMISCIQGEVEVR
jgi:hypothetical protein